MPVPDDRRRTTEDGKRFIRSPSSVFCRPNSIDRKTSLLRDRPEDACGQAASWMWIARGFKPRRLFRIDPLFTMSDKPPARRRGREPKASGARNLFLADEHRSCWWSQTGSNRRPPACKAGALPTELWPRQDSEISNQKSETQEIPISDY